MIKLIALKLFKSITIVGQRTKNRITTANHCKELNQRSAKDAVHSILREIVASSEKNILFFIIYGNHADGQYKPLEKPDCVMNPGNEIRY